MRFQARSLPALFALLVLAAACVKGPRRPAAEPKLPARETSPLGPSYVLIPVPSDDDSLLGRVLREAPEPGRALQEIAGPNPCLPHLEEPREVAMVNDYEDAQELGFGSQVSAMLGTFGFGGGARQATHLLYKIQTQRKKFYVENTHYEACCKTMGCGYGYVAELVYGEGEYAAGEETSVRGNVDVAFTSASGDYSLKVLQRKSVRGYLAAIVKVNQHAKQAELGPLGLAAKAGVLQEASVEVRERYELEQVRIVPITHEKQSGWAFADGTGPITENDFIRRYGEVTGTDDLDDYLGRRNTGSLIISPVLAAGFGALGTWGTLELIECHKPDGGDCSGWYWAGAVGGGLMTLGSLSVIVNEIVNADGHPIDHSMDKGDANKHVRNYNRRLLRQIVREVEEDRRGASGFEMKLHIGIGQLGMSGSF